MAGRFTNYIFILRIAGVIALIIGISMIVPLGYACFTNDVVGSRAFMLCCPATILIGISMMIIATYANAPSPRFGSHDAYIIVSGAWIVASVVGAFPYYLTDFTSSFIDSLFESTSGFTTTGCTVFHGVDLSNTLLLWKAISNWLGGMGILVFVISILPALGVSGLAIASAEAPGPVLQKTTVRTSDTAKTLYVTYTAFTLLEFIALLLTRKMPLYDCVITTLASVSTGGLVIHPEGLAFYNSFAVEAIVCIFCILSSINYVLYFYAVTGDPTQLLKDYETRVFFLIIGIGSIICTLGFMSSTDVEGIVALRQSVFQMISMSTTAGFLLSSEVSWPVVCQITLIAAMLIGGCASSTSGSMKVIRIIVAAKLILRGGIRRIHPRAVVAVRIGEGAVSAPIVSSITAFILTYIGMIFISSILLATQGHNMETVITTSMSLISNTGLPFNDGTFTGDFGFYHPLLKIWLCILMVMGRLELYTIMILLSPQFWKKKNK